MDQIALMVDIPAKLLDPQPSVGCAAVVVVRRSASDVHGFLAPRLRGSVIQMGNVFRIHLLGCVYQYLGWVIDEHLFGATNP